MYKYLKTALKCSLMLNTVQETYIATVKLIIITKNILGDMLTPKRQVIESYGSNTHIGFVPYHEYHFKNATRV